MTSGPQTYDAIVLGGGAAGLMCALTAAQRGKRVALLEHNETVGKKIRISGGGRCNFTNIHAEPARYLSSNPRFCYSALSRYTPADFIAYVERHRIAYHEKKLGQLFCDGSAQQIIDALVNDCAGAGVDILVGCRAGEVQRGDDFSVASPRGTFHAPALVVATGGLSIPKLGATDFGYRLARQFDLPIVPCLPGLVPLTLPDATLQNLSDLSGISFDAAATIGKTTFNEAVLITHRGLSGPAILQASSYWEPGQGLRLDLYPGTRMEEHLLQAKRNAGKTFPKALLGERLSTRFAQRLCEHNHWQRPLGEMGDADLRRMANALQQWPLPINGTEGYAKAEVTRGGVDTRALSPKTMQANHQPGLYFIGEVTDVTGWLGGYNFQWAWASAVAAGNAV
jgi:hypothetical protein